RHVELLRRLDEAVDDRTGPLLEKCPRRGETDPESLHVLVLIAIDRSQPESGNAVRGGQLGQRPELAPGLELGAVYRVTEVGMDIDVHYVAHPTRLGDAAPNRESDRVTSADRHHHRAAVGDPA